MTNVARTQVPREATGRVHTRGVRILQAQPDAPADPTPATTTPATTMSAQTAPAATPPAPTPPTAAPPTPTAGGGAAAVMAASPSKAPIVPAATDPAARPAPARPDPAPVASVVKACPRPFSAPDLRVDATADLRRTLGPRLRAGQRVVLDLAAPYAASATAPSGIAPWFSAIRQSGGKIIVVQYCQRTRSAFGNWIAKFLAGDPGRAYASARKFDAILHADALDQVVTQIEFVPRAGGAS